MIRRYSMLGVVTKTAWRRCATHRFYLPQDRPSAKLCGSANASLPRVVPFGMQPRFFSKDKEHANGSTSLADFVPTKEWQTVKEGQILPPGLEIDVNVTTGEKRARLKTGIEEAATVVEESATEAAAGGKDAAKPTPPPPPPPRKKKGKRIGGMSKEEMERRLREAKAPSRRQQTNKQMKEAKASGNVVEPNKPRRTVEEKATSTEPTIGSKKTSSLSKADGEAREGKAKRLLSLTYAFFAIPPIAFLYQKFVNKDDDPLSTWVYNFEKYKSEYFGESKSDKMAAGTTDDNEPVFETLEEYEAYKKKNPFRYDPKTNGSRNAEKRQSDVGRDPNRPMTMSERLKQYEQGKVDVLKPIKLDKKEDEAEKANIGEETKKKELSDSSSLEDVKPKQDEANRVAEDKVLEEENGRQGDNEFEKALEKPKWMQERDEQRSKRWFKSKRQREQEEWDRQMGEETSQDASKAFDDKAVIRKGLENMLQRKRNEEARYRKSIGLRSYSTLFQRKEKHGRNEEQNAWLEKFKREKEQIKKNLRNL